LYSQEKVQDGKTSVGGCDKLNFQTHIKESSLTSIVVGAEIKLKSLSALSFLNTGFIFFRCINYV